MMSSGLMSTSISPPRNETRPCCGNDFDAIQRRKPLRVCAVGGIRKGTSASSSNPAITATLLQHDCTRATATSRPAWPLGFPDRLPIIRRAAEEYHMNAPHLSPQELLQATHEFPGKFVFKAIGRNDDDFIDGVVAVVRSELHQE